MAGTRELITVLAGLPPSLVILSNLGTSLSHWAHRSDRELGDKQRSWVYHEFHSWVAFNCLFSGYHQGSKRGVRAPPPLHISASQACFAPPFPLAALFTDHCRLASSYAVTEKTGHTLYSVEDYHNGRFSLCSKLSSHWVHLNISLPEHLVAWVGKCRRVYPSCYISSSILHDPQGQVGWRCSNISDYLGYLSREGMFFDIGTVGFRRNHTGSRAPTSHRGRLQDLPQGGQLELCPISFLPDLRSRFCSPLSCFFLLPLAVAPSRDTISEYLRSLNSPLFSQMRFFFHPAPHNPSRWLRKWP